MDVHAERTTAPAMSIRISNTTPTITAPYKNDIGWRYKIINGILYKRQYDYTNQKWIGKWIKA